MWPAGFPIAFCPLWQVAQVPGWMPTWLKRAPANEAVVWQDSQGCVTGVWFFGMITAATLLTDV